MLKIALIGYGTVGQSVCRMLSERCSDIQIRYVVARDATLPRAYPSPVPISCDIAQIYADPDVDVVCEVAGTGPDVLLAALKAGKHVVTANKAALSAEFEAILTAAHSAGRQVLFEAAVAGGVPIIAQLRQQSRLNTVSSVRGIINGATNAMLSHMHATGGEFSEVLANAQAAGWLEADPSDDVDGWDALRKLRLLATLAFDSEVSEAQVFRRGIGAIRAVDVTALRSAGFVIKLCGDAHRVDGGVSVSVLPTAVPTDAIMAQVDGPTNVVTLGCSYLGDLTLLGLGAGGNPTANAVISDLLDLAAGIATTPSPASRPARTVDESITCYVRGYDVAPDLITRRLGSGVVTCPIPMSWAAALPDDTCVIRLPENLAGLPR